MLLVGGVCVWCVVSFPGFSGMICLFCLACRLCLASELLFWRLLVGLVRWDLAFII